MRRRIFLVVVAFWFCLIPSRAFACSCAYSDVAADYNRAKAIFTGEMLGGTEKLSYEYKGESHAIEAGAVRFTVEEVFKGNVINATTIEIASHAGTSCGPYGLTRGAKYLVFAFADKKDDTILYTGVCTRTKEMNSEYAKPDLDFLRNLPPAGSGGNLRGRISLDLQTREAGVSGVTWAPDIKVNIYGPDDQVISVVTDKDGEFEVKKLKAGKYRVEPQVPENYVAEEPKEVTIDDRGTADVGFGLLLNTRVSGRVVDRDGQGANTAFLRLIEGQKETYGSSSRENGGFNISGATPGDYLLYIDMRAEDYEKNRKYYFPGTFKLDEATVIKIGQGQKIEGLEFSLPEDFKVRTIEGQVYWRDGKPAAGAEVLLLCPRSSKKNGVAVEFMPNSTTADEQGRFRLEGYTSELYWLEARGEKEKDGDALYFHSASRKLVMKKSLKDIKIVLSEEGMSGDCDDE